MKKKHYLIIILLLIIIAGVVFALLRVGSSPLNKPESIAYDSLGKRFLISNVGSGSIVAMDEEGKFSPYMPKAFEAPKGMVLRHGKLYIADPNTIHIVDVKKAKIEDSIHIEGSLALNDLAFGEHNQLYITDMAANCVFVLNLNSGEQEKIISPLFNAPNGIIYDRPRWQMFVVNHSRFSPILSLNVLDESVSIFKDTMFSDLDGIAIDDLGRIYFSSWADEMIIEIPQEQNRFITNLKGYKAAADLYYHLPTNELIVPLFKENRIERIQLD